MLNCRVSDKPVEDLLVQQMKQKTKKRKKKNKTPTTTI